MFQNLTGLSTWKERLCFPCALMNMPPPPQPTAYRACNIALAKAAKTVAVKTMKDAANKLRNNQLKKVNQCVVSCDGTWQ